MPFAGITTAQNCAGKSQQPQGSRIFWIWDSDLLGEDTITLLTYTFPSGNSPAIEAQKNLVLLIACVKPSFKQIPSKTMPISLHPGRLTWNIIMEAWKIIFLSKWVICMFQPLIFQGVYKTTECPPFIKDLNQFLGFYWIPVGWDHVGRIHEDFQGSWCRGLRFVA